MSIYKELTEGPGYSIYNIEDIKLFKKLRDSFVKNIKISSKSKKNINTVRIAMAKMSKGEINRSMINFLTFNKNLSEMMINSCPNLIKKLCGKKLFIQRRAHTTINAPGQDQAKQWAHYEMISGIGQQAIRGPNYPDFRNFEIDHVRLWCHGGRAGPANLYILCLTCHPQQPKLERFRVRV